MVISIHKRGALPAPDRQRTHHIAVLHEPARLLRQLRAKRPLLAIARPAESILYTFCRRRVWGTQKRSRWSALGGTHRRSQPWRCLYLLTHLWI